MIEFIGEKFASLRRDERGVVAIIAGLTLPVVMGMMALAVDVGHLAHVNGQLQHAADSAALAGASAISSGEAAAQSRAVYFAGKNMASNTHGTVLTSSDVVVGNWVTDSRVFTAGGSPSNAVQVTTRRTTANGNPVNLFFAKFMGYTTHDISATAIAYSATSGGGSCVLSLNPSSAGGITASGSGTLDLGCGLAVSSTHASQALKVNGNFTIDATEICVAGSTQVSGTANFVDASPDDGCTPPSDPLSGLEAPPEADDACDHTDFTISASGGTYDLTPGVYCKGITISGSNNTINFAAGTYVLASGGLSVSGGGNTLNGTEVMFYNTERSGQGSVKDIDFSGDTEANLSAPTSGDYAGVLFYQDPDNSSGVKFKVAGTVETNFDGVIYFPDGEVQFSGSAGSSQTCPLKIIADSVTFNGSVDMGSNGGTNCASDNVSIGGDTSLKLVS